MDTKVLKTIAVITILASLPLLCSAGSRADLISIGDDMGCTGDTIHIAVTIDNDDSPLDAFGFDLLFCPEMLSFSAFQLGDLTASWIYLDASLQSPGVLRIGGFDLSEIPAGSNGTIAELSFSVACTDCLLGDTCDLIISNPIDDISSWSLDNGLFLYPCEGPVPTATAQAETATPAPETPTVVPTSTGVPPTDIIEISNISGCNGDTLDLEIALANPSTVIESFGFDFHFCDEMLNFVSCQRSDLLDDWLVLDCNLISPGVLRLGGYDDDFLPSGSSGGFITLRFTINCADCVEWDTCGLYISNPVDDIAGFSLIPGMFVYSCLTTPTPVPTSTPIHPDLITIGNGTGCELDIVVIPVSIQNQSVAIDAFGMDVHFCSDMLELVNVAKGVLTTNWSFFGSNLIEPGRIRIGGYDEMEIPTGNSGTIAELTFLVRCPACVEGQLCNMTLTDLVDDLVGWNTQDGMFEYSCPSFPTPSPTASPTPNEFLIISPSQGCNDEFVSIPISLNHPYSEIDSMGWDVVYCSEMLTYDSCLPGVLTQSWEYFACNEISSGVVRVGGFASESIMPGQDGTVAVLRFAVTCPACFEGDVCLLTAVHLVDDIQDFGIDPGTFTYSCPTETPTSTPTMTPTTEPSPTETAMPPTNTPITPPTNTPVSPPTQTPIVPPSSTPYNPPTNTPVSPPTQTPIVPPTSTPVNPPTNTPVSPPTNTPVNPPTQTPIVPPTSTPVNPPTHTPVSPATSTPLPTWTPEPTSTPDCTESGVRIEMPSDRFSPGDTCWIRILICNLEGRTLQNVPLFFVLDIYGAFWFWPSWDTQTDWDERSIIEGLTIIYIIGEFEWPEYGPAAEGIYLYSAMVNPEMTALIGSLGQFEFAWTD